MMKNLPPELYKLISLGCVLNEGEGIRFVGWAKAFNLNTKAIHAPSISLFGVETFEAGILMTLRHTNVRLMGSQFSSLTRYCCHSFMKFRNKCCLKYAAKSSREFHCEEYRKIKEHYRTMMENMKSVMVFRHLSSSFLPRFAFLVSCVWLRCFLHCEILFMTAK